MNWKDWLALPRPNEHIKLPRLFPEDEFCERMPACTPWTVSVSVMPGEEPCEALEALDGALAKDRCLTWWDNLLDDWKAKIQWPEKPEYGLPVFLPIMADLVRQRLWEDWLDWVVYQAMHSLDIPAEYLDEKAK